MLDRLGRYNSGEQQLVTLFRHLRRLFFIGCSIDDPPNLDATGATIRTGAKGCAITFHSRGASLDNRGDLVHAYRETGAHNGARINLVDTWTSAQEAQAFSPENLRCRQVLHGPCP